MDKENQTVVAEFVFLHFTCIPNLETLLFVLFLIIYILSLMGNLLIIVIVMVDSRLQTAMYFFICNLSMVEVWYTTVTVPKMLENLLSYKRTISIPGCITQYYFFFAFAGIELFILTAMAYDRYLAICNPLRYSTIMNPKTCRNMVVACWFVGFICPTFPSFMLANISFCSPNIINHFFCDAGQILRLACTDTYAIQVVGYGFSTVIVMVALSFTLGSYVHIIITILKMSSAMARKKTFSTCASHLCVVTIYFGTLIFMYVRPAVKYTSSANKIVAVFYSVITPLLNPMIYTLRNKDVKEALKKTFLRNKDPFQTQIGRMEHLETGNMFYIVLVIATTVAPVIFKDGTKAVELIKILK
ncbi:olfactory receptor 6N2-like [Elgaria multicarinata webbii]|uniref:olfactory receptor 6N2-like n=1 Tax=Elgaria multicarinata webbii TaxID=159646 RepID=UPI002FCD165B